jgi:general secretion pathway protein A
MFLEHFGLKSNPFGVTSDARYLYFGQDHRDALSALYLSILDGRGMSAVVAHAGMGKTTLMRYLASRLHGKAATAFLSHPYRSRRDLMRDVLKRLGLESEDTEFHQMSRLQSYLRNLMQRKTKVVLLFDECQALSFEALEQVRLLSNLRSSNMNLLEVVMAGQLEFEAILQRPEHEALRQRISAVARIRRFGEEDVQRYVERRLLISGRREPLLEDDAFATAAGISRGIPRNINHLCYKAMQLAWADGDAMISARLLHEAARDLDWGESGAPMNPAGSGAETQAANPEGTPPVRPFSTGLRSVSSETGGYTRSSRGRTQAGLH